MCQACGEELTAPFLFKSHHNPMRGQGEVTQVGQSRIGIWGKLSLPFKPRSSLWAGKHRIHVFNFSSVKWDWWRQVEITRVSVLWVLYHFVIMTVQVPALDQKMCSILGTAENRTDMVCVLIQLWLWRRDWSSQHKNKYQKQYGDCSLVWEIRNLCS